MEFSDTVLILKVGRFRETDAWVKFFSPTRGVLTAFAFGGMVSKRRFCGCLDPLNQVLFRVQSSRKGEYLNLTEGVLINSPTRIRKDTNKLGLAVNCVKFLEAVSCQGEEAQAAYDLALDALHVIDSTEDVSPLFPLLFRASLSFRQGYAPQLTKCTVCGSDLTTTHAEHLDYVDARPSNLCFLVEQGQSVCAACLPPTQGMRMRMSHGTLRTLDYVRRSGPRDWQKLRLSPGIRKECATAVDHFVRYHLGLAWDKGYYKHV